MNRAAGLLLLAAAVCVNGADILGVRRIKNHVEQVLANADTTSLSLERREKMIKNPVRLNVNMIIPIFGSVILDKTLYGEIRPPAVGGDWILGGIVPAGLTVGSLATRDNIRVRSSNALLFTALGLYIATRAGVLLTINHHIKVYNGYMRLKLGLPGGENIVSDLSASLLVLKFGRGIP